MKVIQTVQLALGFVLVAGACPAQDAARMEQVVQAYVQNGTFMGTVLVARGREVIPSKGYGAANLEWNVSNTPSTKFRIGSITKQFTAASILLLAERGNGGVVQIPSERKEIKLPLATLSTYVGTYEVQPGVEMAIRLDGDHLTTQLTGQVAFPVFAESETKFFLKAVDAQVEFLKDASGAVTHAVMYQNGRELKIPRTSATVAAAPQHQEITLPSGTLARYVGTYQVAPNVELSVTLDGTQLMAQITGQQKFAIFAESERRFFFKVVEATLEFQQDASGAVTGVHLRQGSQNALAPRK